MTSAVVRTHEPPLARPAEFVQGVWRDLRRSPPLAVEMAKRDIRKQYRQSLFGPAVVLFTPLVMTAVALGFRRTGILNVDSTGTPYALFVLVGVILWITFVEALNAPIYGFLAEQRLLARTSAPPEAIVLGKLGALFFNALIRAVLLMIAIAWYRISIPATVLLAPIGLLSLAALGTAVGILIAPINLLYRDISSVLATVTTFWFFFSPVYFPAPAGGTIGAIMRLNPVTPILSDTRSLILTGVVANPLSSLGVTLAAGLLLVICWLYARIVLGVALEQVNE
jgi:lipopolysaccharide transport system permease protein